MELRKFKKLEEDYKTSLKLLKNTNNKFYEMFCEGLLKLNSEGKLELVMDSIRNDFKRIIESENIAGKQEVKISQGFVQQKISLSYDPKQNYALQLYVKTKMPFMSTSKNLYTLIPVDIEELKNTNEEKEFFKIKNMQESEKQAIFSARLDNNKIYIKQLINGQEKTKTISISKIEKDVREK